MKFSDKLSLAWKDIVNRKGRSILTVFSIAIGVILLIVLLGIGDGVVNKVKQLVESFGNTDAVLIMPQKANDAAIPGITADVQNQDELVEVEEDERDKNSQSDLKVIRESDLKNFAQMSDAENISASVKGEVNNIKLEDGSKEYKKNITVYGYNMNYMKDYNQDITVGSDIEDTSEDIVITKDIADNLGFSDSNNIVNKKITLSLNLGIPNVKPFEITGVVKGIIDKKSYMQMVVMSQEKLLPLLNYANGTKDYIKERGYAGVNVYPKDGVKLSDISKTIQDDYGYMTFSMDSLNMIYESIGIIIKGILSIGAIIVMIVSACGLVNTISMILQEKRKMIGVMRSVGGAKYQIRSIFKLQAIIIGLIGAVVGAIFSFIGVFIANNYILESSGFEIALTAKNIIIAIGVTFIISFVAGTFPANKASKLNVVEAVAEE